LNQITLVVSRVYWFINWAVISLIIATILLMVIRLIVIQADLNPFAWLTRTTRRLSDPLIAPIRRALVGFGVDPKYSPLVTILIAVLLGYFMLQLLEGIANTVIGILTSVELGELAPILGFALYGLLGFYSLLVFVRIIFAWAMVSYSNRLMRFLVNTTEPLLGPLRRLIPPVGMWDISPIVAFIIIRLFQGAVAGTLLHGLRTEFLS
jgi:YggT family protein